MPSCSCAATDDDATAPSQTLACCGRLPKRVSDDLEFIELFAEMWFTLGIAGPLIIATFTLVNALLPETNGAMLSTVWIAPAGVLVVAGAYWSVFAKMPHPVRKYASASSEVREEMMPVLRMASLVILVAGVIGIVVNGVLDVFVLDQLTHVGMFNATPARVQALRTPLFATLILHSLTTAVFASYIRDATLNRAPLYALGLLAIATPGILL